MRLKLLFTLIILYVIAGFGWWSYSLIEFSNNEFKLKTKLLKSEMQTCELKIVEEARSDRFLSPAADTFQLDRVSIVADSNLIRQYVLQTFSGRYLVRFHQGPDQKQAMVNINPLTEKQLSSELRVKKRSFTVEAILLTLLIAGGIFGAYFSVSIVFDLSRQQNNFLLSVTHELKTPIAAIKLIGETMTRRELPKEMQATMIGNILENTTRLQDLTENMLTAMQMENDRYKIRNEEIDLSKIVSEVKHNFSLKNAVEGEVEEHVAFYGDPVLLKMTLNNLVENAIKYSGNLPVEVNLYTREGKIVLEVKDRGIGIDDRLRKKVFKKFYRVQDEETRETKGSGLGLFIVKQAVEKHKGKISISHNTPRGTVFTILFPAFT